MWGHKGQQSSLKYFTNSRFCSMALKGWVSVWRFAQKDGWDAQPDCSVVPVEDCARQKTEEQYKVSALLGIGKHCTMVTCLNLQFTASRLQEQSSPGELQNPRARAPQRERRRERSLHPLHREGTPPLSKSPRTPSCTRKASLRGDPVSW